MSYLTNRQRRDLDNYITGHYGEDQFKIECPEREELYPSPAAVAAATRITQKQYEDVYTFASILDGIAQEARDNERKRIFKMGFFQLCREFWRGRKLYGKV